MKLALLFGVTKGLILSIILAALDVAFWKQVIIAAVGGGITSAGAIIAAYIAVRASRKTREEVQHIKRVVGASRRAEDNEAT